MVEGRLLDVLRVFHVMRVELVAYLPNQNEPGHKANRCERKQAIYSERKCQTQVLQLISFPRDVSSRLFLPIIRMIGLIPAGISREIEGRLRKDGR